MKNAVIMLMLTVSAFAQTPESIAARKRMEERIAEKKIADGLSVSEQEKLIKSLNETLQLSLLRFSSFTKDVEIIKGNVTSLSKDLIAVMNII